MTLPLAASTRLAPHWCTSSGETSVIPASAGAGLASRPARASCDSCDSTPLPKSSAWLPSGCQPLERDVTQIYNKLISLVPGEGFEPPTFGLQNRCTATVLTRQSQILSGDHPVIATLFATRRHRSPSRRRL
jgi:hypothetical protein